MNRTTWLVAALALAVGGCGKKDDSAGPTGTPSGSTATGTGSGSPTGTGTGATGTGTGTATGSPTEARARMVHAIWDAGTVDVYLNNGSAPINTNPFPVGGNSDGDPISGYDYIGFPSPIPGGTPYNIKLRDTGGTDVLDYDTSIAAGVEYTIIGMGLSQPPGAAAFPTMGVTIDDSANNSPAAGNHAFTLFHTMPLPYSFDVYVCAAVDADGDGVTDPCDTSGAADHTGLGFGQWTGAIEKAGGALFVTMDLFGDGIPDWGYPIAGAADDFSYGYVFPSPIDPNATPWMLHHVLGAPNLPTPAVTWAPGGTGTGTGATGTGTGATGTGTGMATGTGTGMATGTGTGMATGTGTGMATGTGTGAGTGTGTGATPCSGTCPGAGGIVAGQNGGSGQAQEIIIYSIDHVANQMVIRNVSGNVVNLAAGDICRPFSYATFATHPVLAAIAPGADVTLHLTAAGVDTATDVYFNNAQFDIQASDEMMVYRTAAGHAQNNIEAYVRWGPAAPGGRQGEAVAVGLWTNGDAVQLCPGHNAFTAAGVVNTATGFESTTGICP